jgi:hypothetical protein
MRGSVRISASRIHLLEELCPLGCRGIGRAGREPNWPSASIPYVHTWKCEHDRTSFLAQARRPVSRRSRCSARCSRSRDFRAGRGGAGADPVCRQSRDCSPRAACWRADVSADRTIRISHGRRLRFYESIAPHLTAIEDATIEAGGSSTKGPRENNGARFSWKSDGNAMENSDRVNVVPWSPTRSVASKRSV